MKVMDKQVEAVNETLAGIQTFVERYPFPLDPFQLEAISYLGQGQSVMVAAPTGTGKTIVAEYAIWRAQQRNQRVIYTTPLKALSNQKYRDMRTLYGPDAVGLVTGDIVEHSHASIVIMTTEVYRNMLLEEGVVRFAEDADAAVSSLADVSFVVFDELHYLSDIGRGPVWEEAIICSPPHIQLVGLSATVSNATELADWISRIHRQIALVVHEERAVPLEHYYFLDHKLHLVEDANGKRVERFPKVGGEAHLAYTTKRGRFSFDDDEDWDNDDAEFWQRGKGAYVVAQRSVGPTSPRDHVADIASGAGPNKKRKDVRGKIGIEETSTTTQENGQRAATRPVERMAPTPGEVLTALRDADLLPCLYFLPGRRAAEEAAMSVALHLLTTTEE